MHSHLLARVHDNLEPVVTQLDSELDHHADAYEGTATVSCPYGAGWLTWLSGAIQFLISCGVGANMIEMLVASFQGKPGANRNSFR